MKNDQVNPVSIYMYNDLCIYKNAITSTKNL